MVKKPPAELSQVRVKLPFGLAEGTWTPNSSEHDAAWSLYVELVTRISTQELGAHEGLAREALSSLHQLFAETRSILRGAGPSVGARIPSVGGLAIAVLNRGLRPFLTKWHPALAHWEAQRPEEVSPVEHEHGFPDMETLRAELGDLREHLERYAVVLGEIAGVRD